MLDLPQVEIPRVNLSFKSSVRLFLTCPHWFRYLICRTALQQGARVQQIFSPPQITSLSPVLRPPPFPRSNRQYVDAGPEHHMRLCDHFAGPFDSCIPSAIARNTFNVAKPKSSQFARRRESRQIATARPISTTWSLGSLRTSVMRTELRAIAANIASCQRGIPLRSSRGTMDS